jgi:hypothetical protein
MKTVLRVYLRDMRYGMRFIEMDLNEDHLPRIGEKVFVVHKLSATHENISILACVESITHNYHTNIIEIQAVEC